MMTGDVVNCHLYFTVVFINIAFSFENKTLIKNFPRSAVDF